MDVDGALGSSAPPHSFRQFARALSACKAQPPASLLDQSEGLALLFAEACQARAAAGGDPLDELIDEQDSDESDTLDWRLEEQTWRLIHLLHAERWQRAESDGGQNGASGSAMRTGKPYQTPFSAVQDILEGDASLSELKVSHHRGSAALATADRALPAQIIRDWLSNNLQCTHPVEVRKGYWPFTKNRLRNEKRLGSSSRARTQPEVGTGRRSNLIGATGKGVRSLDPDAANREMSTLELEDATYEKALNKTLFEYVRAGRLDSALDLARQADRSWRAASLRGAALYWRPGLSELDRRWSSHKNLLTRRALPLDDEMEDLSSSMGNRNRMLWKAVCRSACAKTTLEEHERALYGALSGDLKSVLAVSTSWETQLWAHTNARLEAAIDAKLDRAGLWWGQDANSHFSVPGNPRELGAVRLSEMGVPNVYQGEDRVELKDVFLGLAQTSQHGIQ